MISFLSGNPFLMQTFALLCVFSLGLAFACFLKIALPSKKKEFKSKRFALLCVFLSFTVIFYTLLIFASQSLSWPMDFSRTHRHYYILVTASFVLGTLISLFWKIALPVTLVFYISLTIFTNSLMESIFGEQKNIIPIKVESNTETKDISLIYCPLPDTFALPLRRNWFYVGENLPEKDSTFFKNSIVDFYTKRILLKNLSKEKKFPIPKPDFYPGLYSAHIDFEGGDINCKIVKDL